MNDLVDKWLAQKWAVGQYTPSDNFKGITNHSCVCAPNDMDLVAITGPADDRESQLLADLFSQAPALLNIAKAYRNLLRTSAHTEGQVATYNHIQSVIDKAEGKHV